MLCQQESLLDITDCMNITLGPRIYIYFFSVKTGNTKKTGRSFKNREGSLFPSGYLENEPLEPGYMNMRLFSLFLWIHVAILKITE